MRDLPPSERMREAENVDVPTDVLDKIFDNVALIFSRREAAANNLVEPGISLQEETTSTSFRSANNDVL